MALHRRYKRVATLVLLLLCSVMAFAQDQSITIDVRKATLKQVFNIIEKQTGYRFSYRNALVDDRKDITLKRQNTPLRHVLNEVLAGRMLEYSIVPPKTVVISDKAADKPVARQNNTKFVSGVVCDANGEPIIGASVHEEGTKNATVTNIDGRFELNVRSESVLTVSYIGFLSKQVKAGENLKIELAEDNKVLEEVVVVGYGTMKKRNLTGAVSSVDASVIQDSHATNIANALQGSTSGLTVNRTSGAPEGNATLQIRGVTTISDTSPLVIIDGVPGDMSMVNPDDVDHISVLKDAASAAIYGSRAAAGVILITTKRAKDTDFSISYNSELGFDSPTTMPRYTGWKRFMEMTNELRYNDNPGGGKNQTYTQDVIDNYLTYNQSNPDKYPITDWDDVLYKKSLFRQTHSVNIMGGGKNVRTKVSFRYDKNNGAYVNRHFERYMARMNNDFNFGKYIEAHLDAHFTYAKKKNPHTNPYADGARNIPPVYAAFWQNGYYGDVKDGENAYAKMKEGGSARDNRYMFGAKGEINIKPVDGLKISFVASPNFTFNKIKTFVKQIPYTNAENPNKVVGYMGGFYTTNLKEERNDSTSITTQALVNYEKNFGDHHFAAMAGYEYYYMRLENMQGFGNNYELTEYPYLDLSPNDFRNTGGNALEYSYRSLFGRLNYSYAYKYLFEFNLRRDGSSRFARNSRWATFPSVSLGWVISEEKFMQNIKWLNYLKLRGSYGKLGNERIGSYYPYQAAIDFGTSLIMNNGVPITVTTAAQGKYAVHNISWETTETWDLGLDAHFLNNRLGFSFDLYRKNTKGMLLALQIPMFMGYANPDVNAGKMHTEGFDMELSWRDKIGDWRYGVAFNLSDYKSVMGDLKGTEFVGAQINREGSEFNHWYGYISEGIYQSQSDVDNSPKLNKNIKVGDLQYRDISGPDGVPDGVISAEYDRVLLKGSLPRFLYGMNLNVGYKNFDFSMSFQGVGEQWARKTPTMIEGLSNNWSNFPEVVDGKYWSSYNSDGQNANAIYPRLSRSNREANYAMSDFWLYNNWYLRCKNISLGYTLPEAVVKKLAVIKSMRIYVSGNDLFCINNGVKGWDPEVIDAGYPIMKSLMVGMNIKF